MTDEQHERDDAMKFGPPPEEIGGPGEEPGDLIEGADPMRGTRAIPEPAPGDSLDERDGD